MLARAQGRSACARGRSHRAPASISLAVIDVGRGHDDRQRDATPVHQQVPLAPIFFPDPSGWARRFVAPSVPSRVLRRCSAIARRFLPSGRTRPALPAIALQEQSRLLPFQKALVHGAGAPETLSWAKPSTGSLCATRTRWPRTPGAGASVPARARLAHVRLARVTDTRSGTSGSTRAQKSSDTTHESILGLAIHLPRPAHRLDDR